MTRIKLQRVVEYCIVLEHKIMSSLAAQIDNLIVQSDSDLFSARASPSGFAAK